MARNGRQKSTRGRAPRGPRSIGGNSGGQQTTFNPPTIVTAPPQRIVHRFFSSTGTTLRVTRGCLLSLGVIVPTQVAAGNAYPTYTGIKINKVTLWPTPVAAGTDRFVDITWLSDLGQDVRLTRSFVGGPAAALISRPPRMSRSAMWSRADSAASTLDEVLFVVNQTSASSPAILDIELSVVRGDVLTVGATATGGAAVISYTGGPTTIDNGLYYAALDNLTPSNTVGNWSWLPVGVTSFSATAPTTWTRTES